MDVDVVADLKAVTVPPLLELLGGDYDANEAAEYCTLSIAQWRRSSAAIHPATLRLGRPRGGVTGSVLKVPERLSALKG